MTTLTAIVAHDRNNLIGCRKTGAIPWRSKADMERFRKLTLNHVCIVGSSTLAAMPVLDSRTFVCLTSKKDHPRVKDYAPDDLLLYDDVRWAIDRAQLEAFRRKQDEVFVIGGADVYEQLFPFIRRMHVTEFDVVSTVVEPVYFPKRSPELWEEVRHARLRLEPSESQPIGITFRTFERIEVLLP